MTPSSVHPRSGVAAWAWLLARVAAAACALSLLGACAGPIRAKVTNFNAWPADASGSTYSYAPGDPARGELEQATYDGYAGAQLQKYGLRQAAAGATGRFIVEVRAHDSTRQRTVLEPVYDNPVIFVAPTRDRYGNVYPGYWQPDRFGSRYIGDREVTRTVQVNRLDVRILDSHITGPQGPRPVFNATAVYEGDNEDLPDMVPYLVRAVFDGFPGRNGKVQVVKFDARSGERLGR
ncbi:MAG: DUF4136 domain-containing protein [Ramlibacter sp.]|nr:DUF4136 domain-containing protein [Ramlibacter sp.]